MQANDIVAIGFLVLCGVLGLKGCFRGLSGLLVGLVIGCLALGAIAIVSNRAWTGQAGQFFQNCAVTSYIKEHISSAADHLASRPCDDQHLDSESWSASRNR